VEKPPETPRFQTGGAKLSGETSRASEMALGLLLRARADEITTQLLGSP
jgi:hypothetical protein